MIKISYLFWTLLASLFTTLLSYFYIADASLHGYPFAYYHLVEKSDTISNMLIGQYKGNVNYIILGVDILFWWLIFSTLLVIVKNYIFD